MPELLQKRIICSAVTGISTGFTACLIAVSQTEAELTYNVLSGFSSIIRALLDNFVLPTIAQMTTWVSRRYFMTAFR